MTSNPPRTLAIGDIHGCDVALDRLLALVAPRPDDTLVVLGDVIDRGPNTRGVIERLMATAAECRLVLLLGNHEEMLLRSIETGQPDATWMTYGGREMLASYDPAATLADLPASHIEFLRTGRESFENETAIFVHANVEPGKPLAEQSGHWLRWARLSGTETPHPSGKRIVCGHTPIPTGLPALLDGWVAIDTWAYASGWLTCFDTTNDLIYQSRQTGEVLPAAPLGEVAFPFRPALR